jgi:hypothetical protein
MKNWLTNCAWEDGSGGLHIDIPRMLDELGVPDTPEYRAKATEIARQLLEQMLKDRPAVIKVTD